MFTNTSSFEAYQYAKQQARKKVNMIGFRTDEIDDPNVFFHCSIHNAARLVAVNNERGVWQCPECGIKYLESQLMRKTGLQSKKSKLTKSKVISLNKKKKLYDSAGNEINTNDKDIMQDIAQGRTVREYREYTR